MSVYDSRGLVPVADVRGFWSYFLPVDVAMSTSMMFELFKRCGRSGR